MDKLSLTPELESKYRELSDWITQQKQVLVAFSGGVDSAFLTFAAWQALGKSMCAATIDSPVHHPDELNIAKQFAAQIGFKHIILPHNDLDLPEFSANTPQRCYFCKKHRFQHLMEYAHEHDFTVILEGSNLDDENDYRPGMKAVKELNIFSPLIHFGFTKNDIRSAARDFNLPIWNKPAEPCLATRIAWHNTISREKIEQIRLAEDFLQNMGFHPVRVRLENKNARIEVSPKQFDELVAKRTEILEKFESLGFTHISIDMRGYRRGSMNEDIQ